MSMHYDHEEESKKRKETDAQRRKRIASAVSEVLASDAGRTVLAEIIGFTGLEDYNTGHDAITMSRAEGKRAVGIDIINFLRSQDLGGYMKLNAEILRHDR